MTFLDASAEDVICIESLIGRTLSGRCAVVVRRATGEPVVIENEPHLRDGTPMPTLFWLIDPDIHDAVSRLESDGGVHRFEEEIDADVLAQTHRDYAARRSAATLRREGPQPTGGVGGTRQGIKCLHAHLAHYLAGFPDPVGALVAGKIGLPPLTVCEVRA